MRYHFRAKNDECNSSSSYTVWSPGGIQAPDILRSIQNPSGVESVSFTEELSNIYSLDTSPSQKRKILDCEKGDFEERFRKIQRKKQLQRVAAKANLVVDDDDVESDEEDEIYEQMDWIEKENEAASMQSWESSSSEEEFEDDEDSFDEITSNSSVFFMPRSKWKEERRRLLRISMAKIRRVEDPESYLRRSVLINNTVKRLQKDVTMSLVQHSIASTSYVQNNLTCPMENINDWESVNENSSVIPKLPVHPQTSFGVDFSSSLLNNDAVIHFHDQVIHPDLSNNPVHLHLSISSALSSDKSYEVSSQNILPSSVFSKNSIDEQRHGDLSLSPLILKQPSPLHLFSSQPCGLQYRSVIQEEDVPEEYAESNTSILDSVVYHSLVASLET